MGHPGAGRKDASSDDWECRTCKGGDHKPYRNYGFRDTCRMCRARKGECFGRKVAKPGPPSLRAEPRATAAAPPRSAWSQGPPQPRTHPNPDREMLVKIFQKTKQAQKPEEEEDNDGMEEDEGGTSEPSGDEAKVEDLQQVITAMEKAGLKATDPQLVELKRRLERAKADRI